MDINGLPALWLSIAVLFAIIEFFSMTFFGLWMSIAALVPAIVLFLHPEMDLASQLIIWVIASLLCAGIWLKWIRSRPARFIEQPLIGQEGILASMLEAGKTGVVLLSRPVQGRQEWPCYSSDTLLRQTRVKIIAINQSGHVEVVRLSALEE